MQDIWLEVCFYLPIKDILSLAQINTSNRSLISNNHLWKQLFHKNFHACDLNDGFNSWYQFYMYVHKQYMKIGDKCNFYQIDVDFLKLDIDLCQLHDLTSNLSLIDGDIIILNDSDCPNRIFTIYLSKSFHGGDIFDGGILNNYPIRYWDNCVDYERYSPMIDLSAWKEEIISNTKQTSGKNISWFIRNYVKYIVIFDEDLSELNTEVLNTKPEEMSKYFLNYNVTDNPEYPIRNRLLYFGPIDNNIDID